MSQAIITRTWATIYSN